MSDPKVRILAHMNKDHGLAIEDYLNAYGDVAIDDKISNIRMKDLELDSMEIVFKHSDIEFEMSKFIPIDPPMKSLNDSREKLVEMAKFAANKRGYSHIQIREILYPSRIKDFLLLFAVSLPIIGFFKPDFLYGILSKFLPEILTTFLSTYNNTIMYAMFIIHLAEFYFILYPKLRKYRVPTDFKIEWFITCLLDGFLSVERFQIILDENIQPPKKN
ncbi:hypothetical protein B5S28_g2449 [[Candida] boidinii]|nr:hypothetical protein B5S28_g2449 [[Candida] boidinii]